jgi:hypothetical protein
MGIARNIARLIPNGSGLLPNANIEAVAASKLTGSVALATQVSGTLPDANAPSGSVIQVVSATKTDTFSTTSSSYVDVTGLSVSITPSSASNKILITGLVNFGGPNDVAYIRLVRDSTAICVGPAAGNRVSAMAQQRNSTDTADAEAASVNFLDSPNTTSSVTYKIQACNSPGGWTTRINSSADDADQTNRGRTASTITVMEIAA